MAEIKGAPRPEVVDWVAKAIADHLADLDAAAVRKLGPNDFADFATEAAGEPVAWVELLDGWNRAWKTWREEYLERGFAEIDAFHETLEAGDR